MICLHCGKEFTGHKRQYCSKDCRRKGDRVKSKIRYKLICKWCNKEFKTAKKGQIFCSIQCNNKSRQIRHEMNCYGCGILFMPKAADRVGYCSRECAFQVKTKIGKERKWFKGLAKQASNKIKRERLKDCAVCGHAFVVEITKGNAPKYCSDKCIIHAHEEKRIAYYETHKIDYACEHCGKPRSKYANKWCKECRVFFKRASRIRGRIKRKYQIKETEMQWISDLGQFRLDDWKCRICGREVDQLPPYNKPTFAHLDHIRPLSRGGKHILSNVQTLCARCNEKKSDKEQTPELVQNILKSYKDKGYAA